MHHNQRPPSLIVEDLSRSLLRWKPEVLPNDRKLMLRRVACFPIARHDEYETNVNFFTRLGKKKETNKRKIFEGYRR